MESLTLLNVLETVLGPSTHKSGDNYSFYCPSCKHHKKKLEISLTPKMHRGKSYQNSYGCWTCDLRGTNVYSLFKKISAPSEAIAQLKLILPKNYEVREKPKVRLKLPEEYVFMGDYQSFSGLLKRGVDKSIQYLKSRKVTLEQVYRHGVGYCPEGTYANRILIPSYDRYNDLNYMIGRKNSDEQPKIIPYLLPEGVSKDVIIFENMLDFSQPIRLVEGPMDVFASRYNTTPLLGLNLSEELKYELLLGEGKQIYFMLDNDALSKVVEQMDYFSSYGKEVYYVGLTGKDPSTLGFKQTSELLMNAKPYSKQVRFKLKAKLNNQTRTPYVNA